MLMRAEISRNESPNLRRVTSSVRSNFRPLLSLRQSRAKGHALDQRVTSDGDVVNILYERNLMKACCAPSGRMTSDKFST